MRLIKMDDNSTVRNKDIINPNSQFHYMREPDADVSREHQVNTTADSANMIHTQYLNIQRVPDIVSASKNFTSLLNGNELLVDTHGDLMTSTGLDGYMSQEYEGDLMQDDLTDDDRRLAAALVAVQLVNQQKQQTGPHILPLLSTPSLQVGGAKLVQADETVVSMPPLAGPNKISQADPVSAATDGLTASAQAMPPYIHTQAQGEIMGQTPIQPLPPLKKVLSRNRYLRPQSAVPVQPNQVPLEALGIHTEMDSMDIGIGSGEAIKQEMEFILPDDGKDTYDSEEESELPDSDYDLSEDSRRHSLPHKKRIARRLRQPKKQGVNSRPARASHGSRRPFQTGCTQTTSNKFSCELCFQSFNNQWKFFEHLKMHYEPLQLDGSPATNRRNSSQAQPVVDGVMSTNEQLSRRESRGTRLRPTVSNTTAGSAVISQRPPAPRGSMSPRAPPPRLNPMPKVAVQRVANPPRLIAPNSTPDKNVASTSRTVRPKLQLQNVSTNRWSAVGEQLQDIINAAPLLQQQLQGTVVQTLWECTPCKRVFKRQKAFESHMAQAHLKDEPVEEFSEPEDMMEGIKVQVGSDEEKDTSPVMKEVAIQKEWYEEANLHSTEVQIKTGADGIKVTEEDVKISPNDLHTETDLDDLNPSEEEFKTEELTSLQALPATSSGNVEDVEPEDSRTCVLCREIFISKKEMKQHISQMHGDIMNAITKNVRRMPDGTAKKGSLVCKECGRRFHHRNSLLYHVRSHGGERAHQCEVCGKSFFARSALKVHMRQHSGAKPFKCEFCGRFFRQWGDLKYHVISIHSDQRNYQCEFCGKDFARKYSLTVHSRIHTGERNYKCEFCGKSFRAATYLQNHRRVHTGEKPHMCEICCKAFRVRSDMKRHMSTHRDASGNNFSKSKLGQVVSSPNQPTDSKFISDVTEVQDQVSDQQLAIGDITKVEELEVSTVECILSDESVRATSRLQEELTSSFIPRENLDSQREQNTLYFWQVFPT